MARRRQSHFAVDIGRMLRGGDPADVAKARLGATRGMSVIVGFAAGCGIGVACKAVLGLWSCSACGRARPVVVDPAGWPRPARVGDRICGHSRWTKRRMSGGGRCGPPMRRLRCAAAGPEVLDPAACVGSPRANGLSQRPAGVPIRRSSRLMMSQIGCSTLSIPSLTMTYSGCSQSGSGTSVKWIRRGVVSVRTT